MSLSERHKELIKATIPVLEKQGVALAEHMYKRMLSDNAELRPLFNQAHQQSGVQSQALAKSILTYAMYVDQPMVIASIFRLIAQKHASINVLPEQYPIVGKHLVASIQEILGDKASDELLEAWAAAYDQLAQVLINIENRLHESNASTEGGWVGWRTFRVSKKVLESDKVSSFYLEAEDKAPIPDYQAGQYISIRLMVSSLGYSQIRQYSLSNAPKSEGFRISVRKEMKKQDTPAGMISTILHEGVEVGSTLEVSAPQGSFILAHKANNPLVFMSAGIGQAPLIAMLDQLQKEHSARSVFFVHACQNSRSHAFKDWIQGLKKTYSNLNTYTCYEFPLPEDKIGVDYDASGRLNIHNVWKGHLPASAEYYICGPVEFVTEYKNTLRNLGVDAAHIKTEIFDVGAIS